MADSSSAGGPDNTAERVALWPAIHMQVDSPSHVLDDEIGLQLIAPPEGWRDRPDMNPAGTSLFRDPSSRGHASSKIWWLIRLC